MAKGTRVMLINPPFMVSADRTLFYDPPLSLASLAAGLTANYEVQILDCRMENVAGTSKFAKSVRFGISNDEIETRIHQMMPDVVGVTCAYSDQAATALEICHIARAVGNRGNRYIVTVVGGAHATGAPHQVLEDPMVDFVVLGEGEQTLYWLIRNLEEGKGYAELDGLAYRNETGQVVINPHNQMVENLDLLPLPARELLPMNRYMFHLARRNVIPKFQPHTTMVTSRGGCIEGNHSILPWIWGTGYRARSVGKVLEEIARLVEEFGVREIHFEDDNFFFDKQRAVGIMEGMIRNKWDLHWAVTSHVQPSTLDEQLLKLMKSSKCHAIHVCFPATDPKVLANLVGSPMIYKTEYQACSKVRKHGISVYATFLFGYPGETMSQIQESLKQAQSGMWADVKLELMTAYPGTPLYSLCAEKNLLVPPPTQTDDFAPGLIRTNQFDPVKLARIRNKALLNLEITRHLRNPSKLGGAAIQYLYRVLRFPPYLFTSIYRLIRNLTS